MACKPQVGIGVGVPSAPNIGIKGYVTPVLVSLQLDGACERPVHAL